MSDHTEPDTVSDRCHGGLGHSGCRVGYTPQSCHILQSHKEMFMHTSVPLHTLCLLQTCPPLWPSPVSFASVMCASRLHSQPPALEAFTAPGQREPLPVAVALVPSTYFQCHRYQPKDQCLFRCLSSID
jgi:hypothetical protein